MKHRCLLILIVLALNLSWVSHSRLTTWVELPAPKHLTSPLSLWATWYWMPQFENTADGIPLLSDKNKPLGPRLAQEDFCTAAVEGTVRVNGHVYNYAALGESAQADCTQHWAHMPHAPYVRFQRSSSLFGEGDDYYLVPYRSIAVDPKRIPIGTVLYIPAARGTEISLPDGSKAIHDGYFFAADDGHGIEETHIDVFLGVSNHCPFSWVKSRAFYPFEAYVISDPSIVRRLKRMHHS